MSGFVKSLRSLARRLASKRSRANGARPAEAGAAWSDAMFAANPHYHCHYRESFYYFLWTVIADRLRRQSREPAQGASLEENPELAPNTAEPAVFPSDEEWDAAWKANLLQVALEHRPGRADLPLGQARLCRLP